MIPLPEQLTFLNLLFCLVVIVISLYGFWKIGNPTPLFIGGAFVAFGISHSLTLMNLAGQLQIPLAIIRTCGYILVATGISLIIREVIRRYDAEHALLQSHEVLEERVAERTEELVRKNGEQEILLDTMEAQVWYLTDHETYGAVNRAHASFLGRPEEEIEYQNLSTVLQGELRDLCLEGNAEVFSKGTPVRLERWISDKEGKKHLLAVSKTPKLSKSGTVDFVVCMAVDNTERKREEERLLLANRKLNMLSSVTRHDILNDIQLLFVYLDMTGKRLSDPELWELHKKEVAVADAITKKIEFTRFYQDIGVQKPVWQDVASVIHSEAEKIPLLDCPVDIGFSGVRVLADPLFSKAIYNLIDNAVRHGGTVTRISFSLEPDTDGVTLVCADDGVGISTGEKKKIFERGYGKNTGFGLFLIREILSITQISIIEAGRQGEGAVFRMKIPNWAFSSSSQP